MSEMSLGDRIAQIRRRRSMTQEELAGRAGISADVIRKLEQNRRDGAHIRTLHAIARALEIETSELLRDGVELDRNDNGDAELLLSLRRVLVPAPGAAGNAGEPFDSERISVSLTDVTLELKGGRYRGALSQLSELLRHADTDTSTPETIRIVSAVYLHTGRTLIQLGYEDLAYEAVRRSMQLATDIGDAVLNAAAADALVWILIRQARFTDAEESALHFAATVDQPMTSNDRVGLAVFGQLALRAAASAARNNRTSHSVEYLSMARAAAARIGGTVEFLIPHRAVFGPPRVTAIEVESAMVAGDAERALAVAEGMPVSRGRGMRRHLLAIAEAQAATRQHASAANTLMSIRATAPEWLVAQRLGRRIVRDLLDSQGVRWARNSGIADLASDMKIAV